MIPGEIKAAPGEIELNKGRNPITIEVANTGDRPIQVGSHYHFFETNEALKFDRKRTKGMRLDIAAGTAVRFEPGQSRTVRLTPYMGGRESHGFQAKVSGKLGPDRQGRPVERGPDAHLPLGLCPHVRADDGRQGAAGRHRPLHRGREGPHDLRRGGEVRRRQGDPRRHGPEPAHAGAGRGRHRDHQCADRRSLGHREGRYRPEGRPHRRHRQGRQPRHPAQGRHHHRPRHRGDRGRGQDRHRGRHRLPHPFHLPAADRRCALQRRHHHDGRRHRAGARHLRHHHHARPLAYRPHAAGGRGLPDESRLLRQGQHQQARRHQGAGRGRRLRAEAARGLGHHARRHRQLPDGGRPHGCAGGDPHRHAERIRASSRPRGRPSRAAPSPPSTPRARAAAMRPTSFASAARRT